MMLHELQILRDLVKQLGRKYENAKKELHTLKQKPTVEASRFEALKQAHNQDKTELEYAKQQASDLKHEFNKLSSRLDEKTKTCEELLAQVAKLTAENDELLAKNEISSQRAQTILERLAALDKDAPETAP